MKILFIFGTRPEAIKLAPLIHEFKKHPTQFDCQVVATSQHKSMLQMMLDFFKIQPDYDLKIMKPNQSLEYITSQAILKLGALFRQISPDLIFIQGDTTTVMTASITAYYHKIKVAHIEAGLRTYQKYSPFPEEINRIVTSHVADYHFAPTDRAKENLKREGVNEDSIWVVGNTVIDALFYTWNIVKQQKQSYEAFFAKMGIRADKKTILVTGHRRENFGEGLKQICLALQQISEEDVQIVYPVHLNPNVRNPVNQLLKNRSNIHLIEPLPYDQLVYLMHRCHFVLTDSGGIQEEAPSLGKPVLIMREVTERPEGIEAGTARLVGTDKEEILARSLELLQDDVVYNQISRKKNPYGDGHASKKIYRIMDRLLETQDSSH